MGYSMFGIDLPDSCASALGCLSVVIIIGAVGVCTCSSWVQRKISDTTTNEHTTEPSGHSEPATQESDAGSTVVFPAIRPPLPSRGSPTDSQDIDRKHHSRGRH